MGRIARAVARRGARTLVKAAFPRASRIQTHLTPSEKLVLFAIACAAPGPVCLEIGSYLGASATFIAAGARLRWRRRATVYCVDTWENQGMTEGERDTFAEFQANTAPWADVIHPLRGDSQAVGADFSGSVDFLFVDGAHDYDSVRGDAEVWLPRISRGGFVAFHDYAWAEGVRRTIDELVAPRSRAQHTLPNLYWARL